MPLRSSLALSLQYAMANMADIKTPLCALQPTPAIPHTASRSGAGTRAGWRGGGGERGLERAPARSARPANPRRPLAALAAPGCSRPPPSAGPEAAGAEGAPGRREPTLRASSRSLSHARCLPAPFADRRRCRETICTARRLSERPRQENCWAALLPEIGELRHLSPRLAAGTRGRGDAGGHGRGRWG